MSEIRATHAREVLDSRGNLTVEVEFVVLVPVTWVMAPPWMVVPPHVATVCGVPRSFTW